MIPIDLYLVALGIVLVGFLGWYVWGTLAARAFVAWWRRRRKR